MGIIDKLKNMDSDEDDALALGFVAGGTAGVFGNQNEDADDAGATGDGDVADGMSEGLG